VLEKTAVDVDAMMVRITADKKEAAATQKAVAKQEQEANEQAALANTKPTLFMPDLHMRYISAVLCIEIVRSGRWYDMQLRTALGVHSTV